MWKFFSKATDLFNFKAQIWGWNLSKQWAITLIHIYWDSFIYSLIALPIISKAKMAIVSIKES